MRTAFIEELTLQARIHPEIFLMVGDIGFSVVESFAEEFPDRFLNVGVAEQNMTGVAAGLASEGFHVFTYSIANFPVLRCLEQIRNDVCYHELPVTVVAVGAGVAYGNMGYTHHAIQDLAVMRSLNGMSVLSPADPGETRECMRFLTNRPGPSYLRLGKAGEETLHEVRGIDRGPLLVREGREKIALVATGSILKIMLIAAEQLKQEHDLDVAVYSCPWLTPPSVDFFESLWKNDLVISMEEHGQAGGFGEMLSSLCPSRVALHSLSLPPQLKNTVGSQAYLREAGGLTVDKVVSCVLSFDV